MSSTTRVITGLVLGACVGLALAYWNAQHAAAVAAFVQPVGKLWLNALQMTVVPLVAALVVLGVNNASDAAASGRIARGALLVFVILLLAATSFAAIVAPHLLALLPRDEATLAAFRSTLAPVAAPSGGTGLAQALIAIIPSNAINAAASSAMLPLVTFALFFGFALTRIESERRARMLDLVQTIADTMIVIVRWVLLVAPLGVFALVLAVCAQVGAGVVGALLGYIAMLCTLYASVTVMLYLVARIFAGEKLRRFASAILPAQVVAFSTSSSLASLPAMLESARVRLGYPLEVSSLVLPMAVSLFRITSPIQYIGVSSFVAWLYGIDIPAAHIAVAVVLAVVMSMGSVGLPGQVSFMATNLPVVHSLGLPLEPLGILLSVDTLPDVLCTVGNVTGDLTATGIVAKRNPSSGAG
ncbi:MAG: cation:dicarboxylase symporter family transporter [Myxococcales bacterium]